jgi:hypothetical protein
MLIKAFNIEWETNGEEVDLPTEAFFEVRDDLDVADELSDMLTDEYGWLVNYAEWEIV